MRSRKLTIAIGLALLVGGAGSAASAGPDGGATRASEQPNIVVVVTDDQDSQIFNRKVMPRTFRLLNHGGTQLTNFIAASPLCCPSRATQLTGQYGHNNGVLQNHPGYTDLDEPGNVLPVWLRRAGYQTAHVGRFLNGYWRGKRLEAAPGWDRWISLIGLHYRDYDLSIDGRRVKVRGDAPGEYVTRDIHRRTNRLVRGFSASGRPFFIQIDELAPHSDHLAKGVCERSALPGPGLIDDVRGLPGVRLPEHPAGEKVMSDKPPFIRRLQPLNSDDRDRIQRRMRCRAASLREVDRGIGELVKRLRRYGELADTVFVFYSDNGFFDGQHRIVKSKGLPYEPSLRVPAMIRVPERFLGAPAPRRVALPTANIDVAPTLLDLAGAEPCSTTGCRRLDGRSLLDALRGDPSWSPERPLLIEIHQEGEIAGGTLACSFTGVRVGKQVYVDYQSVVRVKVRRCRPATASEHYRLDEDPKQNHNLWPATTDRDRAAQSELSALERRLKTCSGNLHQPAEWIAKTGGPPANPCE
jgi:arylsulfatase A-like enzyme